MPRARSVPYAQNSLFRDIPRDLLKRGKIIKGYVSYEPGEIVFDEGGPPDYCYLVGSGAVRITKALPDGGQELLATMEPGDFFGELALYDSSPRSARATAVVPTRLARLDEDSFQQLRVLAPLEISSTLAEITMERVRETNLRLVAELTTAGRLSRVGDELSTLSHNLRSPLATIRNAADLLYDWVAGASGVPPETARFIEIVRRTADGALAQIDDLMAHLRGEDTLGPLPVPVGELLADLVEQVSGVVDKEGVTFEAIAREETRNVVVDRREFVAALSNLVKNSVEALPEDGGKVQVTVEEAAAMVVFSVSDTGSGIPPQHLARLFEKGFTHGKAGGSGIGLAHARAVVEKLGGRIEVESEVGRGTTIRLKVPGV